MNETERAITTEDAVAQLNLGLKYLLRARVSLNNLEHEDIRTLREALMSIEDTRDKLLSQTSKGVNQKSE
ncbi:hypothetical protein [Paenibacillus sp. Cedars]|uniref:hypothetical protein n=1 Tax=Paenibacillus sp. Cedars TaxID=1980674 RepID=UPI001164BD88|nr:hypothetical protein [Paenibacillus sp. Cedars]AWP28750.1 hypothetical protein B9D94_19900 [Paenibacillus sp. Cedars]